MTDSHEALQKETSKDTLLYRLFRKPLQKMGFEEMAESSAILQAIKKSIKSRRSQISSVLDERILEGDVEGHSLEETSSGKSKNVLLEGMKVQRTERGKKKKASVGMLREVLEKVGAPEDVAEEVVVPQRKKLNEGKVKEILDEHGIDESEVYDYSRYEVDVEKLKTLASVSQMQDIGFEITDEDIEEVFVDVEPSVSVKCTFDGDMKSKIMSLLEEESSSEELTEDE